MAANGPEIVTLDRTEGVSLSGKSWGRPDDTAGSAGVAEGVSSVHGVFVNAGDWASRSATDSRRMVGPSRSSRTYYSYARSSSTRVSFDHRCIASPAYNADGGPVDGFSGKGRRWVEMRFTLKSTFTQQRTRSMG
jgi:high affinity Mn2+ porin